MFIYCSLQSWQLIFPIGEFIIDYGPWILVGFMFIFSADGICKVPAVSIQWQIFHPLHRKGSSGELLVGTHNCVGW